MASKWDHEVRNKRLLNNHNDVALAPGDDDDGGDDDVASCGPKASSSGRSVDDDKVEGRNRLERDR